MLGTARTDSAVERSQRCWVRLKLDNAAVDAVRPQMGWLVQETKSVPIRRESAASFPRCRLTVEPVAWDRPSSPVADNQCSTVCIRCDNRQKPFTHLRCSSMSMGKEWVQGARRTWWFSMWRCSATADSWHFRCQPAGACPAKNEKYFDRRGPAVLVRDTRSRRVEKRGKVSRQARPCRDQSA